MSKFAITASAATEMFAVSCWELLNVVELTVTPPGFVVPVTNHCALAPFLNPLPPITTFRLTVPWAAELGLADLTWIWPVAGNTLPSATKSKKISDAAERRLDSICPPQEERFEGLFSN